MLHIPPFSSNNILVLSEIESTNTYTLQAVHAGKLHHGNAVQALAQTAGRGQRQNTWHCEPSKDLLLSLVLQPLVYEADSIFLLNMCVSLALQSVVAAYSNKASIKWSNDIYHDQYKVAGILIENVWRGDNWQYAVVGIGLNVNSNTSKQPHLNGISLSEICDHHIDITEMSTLFLQRLNAILAQCAQDSAPTVAAYNQHLFMVGQIATFLQNGQQQQYTIDSVGRNGKIKLQARGQRHEFAYGEVKQVL